MPRLLPERGASQSSDSIGDWLTVSAAPGVGPRTFRRLLEQFGTPASLLAASDEHLARLGLKPDTIAALRRPEVSQIDAVLAWAEHPHAHVLTLADARYPAALREIPDAPPLLYVRGDPGVLSEPQIAIVGSRNPTPTGQEITDVFARQLAGYGLTVTSGLAVGVDGVAHAAALGQGRTIAVLGTGPDLVYPATHRDLARRIVEQGAMVSELAPGQGPQARNFPRRNRIISGLGLGVLVTEAALKSGSLITARCALEQGREVFAVPGSIRNPLSRGCHALIREGAKLVECAEDVLAELAPQLRSVLQQAESVPTAPVASQEASDPEHQRLLDAMGYDPVAVDQLVERTGLPVEQISSMLLLMELNGHVLSTPGGRYCRAR